MKRASEMWRRRQVRGFVCAGRSPATRYADRGHDSRGNGWAALRLCSRGPIDRDDLDTRVGAISLSGAVISAEPRESLADEQVSVSVSGLAPGEQASLRAETRFPRLGVWRSHAVFKADGAGNVDLSEQAPVSGCCEGVDPMGLFWSMTPDAQSIPEQTGEVGADPIEVTLTAEAEGKPVTRTTLRRLFLSSDVVRVPVRERGLVGTFFHVRSGDAHPGLLVVGGSEGGLVESQAALLASRGYAALALAYFGLDGLPQSLCEIPIAYFGTAIDWMRRHPAVDTDRMGVVGWSKGGELALLLGATYPEIRAVVGYVPSGIVFFGLGRDWRRFRRSSWSLAGRPIAFARMRIGTASIREMIRRGPVSVAVFYREALRDKAAVARSAIQVEKIQGPVLLVSGGDDRVWPSAELAQMAIARLARHDHPYPFVHLTYEGAGHLIGRPYMPAMVVSPTPFLFGRRMAFGGDPRLNAEAARDSWPKTLRFLEEHLKS